MDMESTKMYRGGERRRSARSNTKEAHANQSDGLNSDWPEQPLNPRNGSGEGVISEAGATRV